MPAIFATANNLTINLPIYLTTIGTLFEETYVLREEGFNDYQLLITTEGEGKVTINDTTFTLTKSTGLFLPPNLPHTYEKTTTKWVTSWVSFNGNMLDGFASLYNFDQYFIFSIDEHPMMASHMMDMYKLATDYTIVNALDISSILYQLLTQLYKATTTSQLTDSNRPVDKALNYIHEHYMQDITIDMVAHAASISPQYLCKLFKKELNQRPFEYIKKLRIHKAKPLLLQSPTKRIEVIASEVGIHNPSYFTSLFKSIEHMTPGQFIRLHQRG